MKIKSRLTKARPATPAKKFPQALLADVRELILATRSQVAQAVNAGLTMLYWQIGRRIRTDILKEQRAEYGERIVAALGRQLELEFGRGFNEKNLRRMMQFAEVFPDEKIVAALRRQLNWTHFKSLIPLDDALKRDFYAEMCRVEQWNKRVQHVELLELEKSGIHIASYWTKVLPKKLLERKLHDAVRLARAQLGARREKL